MIKAAILLILYALVMITIGVITFVAAPPEANAATALIIPCACGVVTIVAAVLTIIGRDPGPEGRPNTMGMIGVHAGLVLPLLFTLAIGYRAVTGTGPVLDAQAALEKIERPADQPVPEEIAVAEAELRKVAGKDYQIVALWSLTGLSLFAFASLVMLRPKPAAADAIEDGRPRGRDDDLDDER